MTEQTDIPKLPDGWEKEDSIDVDILRQNGCLPEITETDRARCPACHRTMSDHTRAQFDQCVNAQTKRALGL